MKLLSGPNAHDFHLGFGRHRESQVKNTHTRNLGHEDLAPMHALNASDDETNALFERDPKPRHTLIGYGHLSRFALFHKQGDNTSRRSDHVAVASRAQTHIFMRTVYVSLNKQFLRDHLCGSIQICGLHRLIGADVHHQGHPLINGGINHVDGSFNVGAHRLNRIVFAHGNMLEGCRVHQHVNICHRTLQTAFIPHVSKKKTESAVGKSAPHFHES